MRARLAHDELRHLEPRREVGRLIGVRDTVLADHLLEPDDVGADLADDVGDSIEIAAAVESDSAVNVVAHDGEVSHAAPAW